MDNKSGQIFNGDKAREYVETESLF